MIYDTIHLALLGVMLRVTRDDRGQNTLEYVIILGVLVAAAFAAFVIGFPGVVQAVVGALCPSIDTGDPLVGPGTCVVVGS